MLKNCFSYPVEIVEDVFGQSETLAKLLRQITGAEEPRVLLVADVNVVNRTEALGSKIGRYFQAHSIKMAASPVVIPGGEKIKADSMQSASKVISAILDARLGVNDVVIVMGGGSLIDVAGYAAAQVRGGIKQLRLPTTLAAMVDAAYSTYSALDSINVKDALRIHCSPAAVIVDPLFSKTVLDGVWRGGISEAVRLSLASDGTFFKRLDKLAPAFMERDYGTLVELVQKCIEVRRKKGDAPLGQWAASRLESMSAYKLPHGYAVAMAICIDTAYALAKGLVSQADYEAVESLLKKCGALDGMQHSRHLLEQGESVILGLDALRLSAGRVSIAIPVGIGKHKLETEPDRETYLQVLAGFAKPAAQS